MSLWLRRRDLGTHLYIATVIKFLATYVYFFLIFLLDFIIVTINLLQLLAAILIRINYLSIYIYLQELVKLAGPTLLRSIGHGLDAYEKGASAAEAVKSSSQVLKRGLKRKIPAAVGLYAKTKAKESYKKKRQRVKDILGV